jgi:hypothetical protein
MAIEGAAEEQRTSPETEAGKPEDFAAHERDYSGFVTMFKWLAIVSFIIAAIVVYIISN